MRNQPVKPVQPPAAAQPPPVQLIARGLLLAALAGCASSAQRISK